MVMININKPSKLKHIFFVVSALLFYFGTIIGLGLAAFNIQVKDLYVDILWLLFASCCAFGGLTMAGDWLQNRGNIKTGKDAK